jgi:adenosine deaminase
MSSTTQQGFFIMPAAYLATAQAYVIATTDAYCLPSNIGTLSLTGESDAVKLLHDLGLTAALLVDDSGFDDCTDHYIDPMQADGQARWLTFFDPKQYPHITLAASWSKGSPN